MIHLPDEILNIICLYLYPDRDNDCYSNGRDTPQELVNMAMVSRAFHHAVRPVLYHTVSTAKPGNAMASLVRTFLRNPNNANYVRKIAIETGGDGEALTGRLSHEDLSRASALARALVIPFGVRAELLSEIGRATHDGLTCLILCLCRDLHTIDVQVCRSARADFSKYFVASLTTRYQPMNDSPLHDTKLFQRVKMIHLQHADDTVQTPLAAHLYWLNLPHLEIFRCVKVNLSEWWQYIHERSPLAKTKLRRLWLEECLGDYNSLHNLLPACPDLVELRIIWGDISHGDLDIESIGRMLRQHGSSLQELHLDTGDQMYAGGQERRVIGSLASLNQLRHLYVTWHFIFSIDNVAHGIKQDSLVEILPTSLEELAISFIWDGPNCSGDADLDAQFLALMGSERFETLRRIRVDRDEPYDFEVPPPWRLSLQEYSMLLERSG